MQVVTESHGGGANLVFSDFGGTRESKIRRRLIVSGGEQVLGVQQPRFHCYRIDAAQRG